MGPLDRTRTGQYARAEATRNTPADLVSALWHLPSRHALCNGDSAVDCKVFCSISDPYQTRGAAYNGAPSGSVTSIGSWWRYAGC
jgi:hypothetical protein